MTSCYQCFLWHFYLWNNVHWYDFYSSFNKPTIPASFDLLEPADLCSTLLSGLPWSKPDLHTCIAWCSCLQHGKSPPQQTLNLTTATNWFIIPHKDLLTNHMPSNGGSEWGVSNTHIGVNWLNTQEHYLPKYSSCQNLGLMLETHTAYGFLLS